MDILLELQEYLMALVLTTPRILVAFAIMPMFAQPIFPAMVRNGVMIIMAITMLPLTMQQLQSMPLNAAQIFFMLLKEGLIGLVLGFAMSMPFWAVRASGFLMDLQRGAMSALFFSPTVGGMVSPLGNLFAQLATVLLFVSGGFLMLMETLMFSYQTWPLHLFVPDFNIGTAAFLLKQLDALMYTTVLIAAPFLGLMLLIDFGAGLIGRFMPMLNVFLIAMPLKSALVFFMLIFYVVIVGHFLHDSYIDFGLNLKILEALIHGGQ